MRIIAIVMLFLFTTLSGISQATIYKWKDDQGKVHFTDSPSKIPKKYRESVETRSSSPGSASTSEESSPNLDIQESMDYRGMGYKSPPAKTPKECQTLCKRDKQCMSFSWHRKGICYMKFGVPELKSDPCCFAGLSPRGLEQLKSEKINVDETIRFLQKEIKSGRLPPYEKGVDYPGWDYKRIRKEFTPETCHAICEMDSKCMSFTVDFGKACILRSKVPPKRFHDCCISGVSTRGKKIQDQNKRELKSKLDRLRTDIRRGKVPPLEKGMNYRGQDYKHFYTDTPEECKIFCEEEERCMSFAWNRGKTCYLKYGIPEKRKEKCCVSGLSARGLLKQGKE